MCGTFTRASSEAGEDDKAFNVGSAFASVHAELANGQNLAVYAARIAGLQEELQINLPLDIVLVEMQPDDVLQISQLASTRRGELGRGRGWGLGVTRLGPSGW